ncbi:hypothetical protein, partial [Staphylococcus aureus]|uniref:hypothetical protein n=1 Tax=Staphylococcus aureus TaxID=1280 RepID=UPI0015E6BA3D
VQLQLDELNSQLQELEAYRIESKITIPEKDFWSDNNYDERQVTNLWTSDELQYDMLLTLVTVNLTRLIATVL